MMKVFKMEVMVLDFEDVGEEELRHLIENIRYLVATVMSAKSEKVEWSDDHPLNNGGTMARAYHDLFAKSE